MKKTCSDLGAFRQASASTGAIVPNALYRLDEVKARMGWRDAAFRAAVRAGLKTHRSGKRLYVLGSDLIAFVTRAKGGDR
jgi:hypothetical protein